MMDDPIPTLGDPDPVRRPSPKHTPVSDHKPKWTRHAPTWAVRCDHCMRLHAETGGRSPLAAQARWARDAGGERELLCPQHAQAQRQRDRIPLEGK